MNKDMRKFYMNTGGRIRTLRKEQQYSIEELAEAANISAKYLCDIEKGKVCVSSGILHNLCKALGVMTSIVVDDNIDVGYAILHELIGRFTEEEKKYIREIILSHINETF